MVSHVLLTEYQDRGRRGSLSGILSLVQYLACRRNRGVLPLGSLGSCQNERCESKTSLLAAAVSRWLPKLCQQESETRSL